MYQGDTLALIALNDGIVELCFDLQNDSVNKFNVQAVEELSHALGLLERSDKVTGLLVTSAKPAFMVGADVSEFKAVFASGPESVKSHLAQNNQNFNRLQALPVPTVVAVDGYALGGGLELCLACDYRIATTGAQLGFPEIKLGIIPGWGGTVRLPRLVGVDTAVDWIASATTRSASEALKAGVVDGIVEPDQLRTAGLHCLEECRLQRLDFQGRRQQKQAPLRLNEIEAGLAFESSLGFVAAKAGPHYPAPVTAIKVMQQAAQLEAEAALELETDAFASLAETPTAQALVGVFLNDQFAAKKVKRWAENASPTGRAAVLGAGIMGGAIASLSAAKGIPVKMKDIAQEGLDQGLAEANRWLSSRVERGRLEVRQMGEALNRIEPTLSFDGFEQVDTLIEAVVENATVKRKVLAEAEQHTSDDAVLASNTSTLSIDSLAESLKRPENFCGMHFFNPVHAMPLVEVIRGKATSDATVARILGYAKALGKKAVVVEDCPGFLVNRVLFPYLAGFTDLVQEGVSFTQIDSVMEAWGWPMGPAYLLDVVGLDTAAHAEKVMADAFPDRLARPHTSGIQKLVEQDRLGQKNNRGFYDYEQDKRGKLKKQHSDLANQCLYGGTPGTAAPDNETLVARLMIPMLAEASRCLEEGIVATPAEADMALVYGVGFPPFRGGLFRWVDQMGPKAVTAMADKVSELGPLYQLPAGLREQIQQERPFYADGA